MGDIYTCGGHEPWWRHPWVQRGQGRPPRHSRWRNTAPVDHAQHRRIPGGVEVTRLLPDGRAIVFRAPTS